MKENKIAKIAVSQSVDESLNSFLEIVNNNFEGGKITKTELASWIISKSTQNPTDSLIEEVRRDNFKQIAYLESLVRKLKMNGRESLTADELNSLFPNSKRKTEKKQKLTDPNTDTQ